ncbi:uncharacterized protein CBL_12670 [Carabus blaptoides fortunei]
MGSQKTEEEIRKALVDKKVNEVSKSAKNMFEKSFTAISKSSGLKQLAVGSVSGWCTGFLTTKVGKTVAISVGGSVILIAAANQAGIVNVNWDKITKRVGETTSKLETKLTQNAPTLRTSVGKYARTNTLFAAGFVGGFLLGLAS